MHVLCTDFCCQVALLVVHAARNPKGGAGGLKYSATLSNTNPPICILHSRHQTFKKKTSHDGSPLSTRENIGGSKYVLTPLIGAAPQNVGGQQKVR
jgi:hypothetical protein